MTNISNKVPGGDWKLPSIPSAPSPAKPVPNPAGGGVEPAPAEPAIDLKSILPNFPGKPIRPVEPKIGLLKSDIKQDIQEIRTSKGTSNVQALLEFKGNLEESSTKELESAQSYLVDEMASPDNKDDQLLGVLLKTVNEELNDRRGTNIKPRPFPMPHLLEKEDPKLDKPIIKGGGGRIVD